MLDIVNATGWLFLSVVVFAALVVSTAWLPKARITGVSVAGATPVPDTVTEASRLSALSLTFTVPEIFPTVVGAKNTLISQNELAPILPLQLSVSVNPALGTITTG